MADNMIEHASSIDKMPPVQMSSVWADAKQPFLKVTTRWKYTEPWLRRWKDSLRYRMFAGASLALGIYLGLTGSILAILGFAAAAYFWSMYKFLRHRLESQRSLMVGQ